MSIPRDAQRCASCRRYGPVSQRCDIDSAVRMPGEWCPAWNERTYPVTDSADIDEPVRSEQGKIVGGYQPQPRRGIPAPPPRRLAVDPADLDEIVPPEHFGEIRECAPDDEIASPHHRTTDPQSSHYAIPDLDLELFDVIRAGAPLEELIGRLRWSIFERSWRLRRKGGDAGALSDARKILVEAGWLVQALERLDGEHGAEVGR